MESGEIWGLGRRRTVGGLFAFAMLFGACSADAGENAALAFDETELVGEDADGVARSVGAGESVAADNESVAAGNTELDDELPQNTAVQADTDTGVGAGAGDADPGADGNRVPVDPDADEAEVNEAVADEAAAAVETTTATAGDDSTLVGTTGVTARDLMRELAEALGGTAEMLGEPERTNDGGSFSFTMTSADGGTSEVDVSFVYEVSPDDADLIVGHVATGVVVTP